MSTVEPGQRSGVLLVVSGPGGVGKGTVVRALRARRPELAVSMSATTRGPRPGEVDGVDYRFVSDGEFDELVAAGAFLEWAEFAGQRYGTLWSSVQAPLEAGTPVVLEIEIQGARQVRERVDAAVLVFLAPPSEQVLRERLLARGTENRDELARRLAIAQWELAQVDEFDHVVVNDALDDAVAEIDRILDAVANQPS